MSGKQRLDRKTAEHLPDIHRVMPASADAEQGVLASCLIEPSVVGMARERGVTEHWFHVPAHATIWEGLEFLYDSGKAIDFIVLTELLRDNGTLDQCGGAAFVTSLFTYLPTAANAAHYIGILEEKFIARRVIMVGTEYASKGYDAPDSTELLDSFEQKTLAIRRLESKKTADVKELVMDVISDLQDAYENRGKVQGLTTGLHDLDLQIDGMHPEELLVIAARPSHGKTALALRMVEHIVIDLQQPCAVFSLEMSAKQLVQRLLLSRAKVNYFAFRDGYLNESAFPAITAAASKLSGAFNRLFIDDEAGMSIQTIRAKTRRLKAEKGIVAAFVDYLQLVTSSSKRAQENRQIEVSEVSVGLKQMARENQIPVVALAQIDRAVEKQQRKPRLSDLRESGSIEQDADLVGFLRRLDLMAETPEEVQELEGRAVLDIAKQRRGPIGEIDLTFLKEYSRFETHVPEQQEPDPQMELDTQI